MHLAIEGLNLDVRLIVVVISDLVSFPLESQVTQRWTTDPARICMCYLHVVRKAWLESTLKVWAANPKACICLLILATNSPVASGVACHDFSSSNSRCCSSASVDDKLGKNFQTVTCTITSDVADCWATGWEVKYETQINKTYMCVVVLR